MEKQGNTILPYRWVVLTVFMLVMGVQQLLWITFAPITTSAAAFYKVSDLDIGILSMIFMLVYILVSIPASWLIDTYGFRTAVGIGALFTGVFGIIRGVFADSYSLVLVSQIGIAIGQPLIVNAVTKVAARWFILKERATATGMSWLAGYLGLIAGLTFTPYLTEEFSIPEMLYIYGIISIVAAAAFILFSREKPRNTVYSADKEEKVLVFDGLKQLMVKKDFVLFNIVFFIGMGVFNGLSTWIENVLKPRGFSSAQAGIIGGLMVACGVLGSGIIPMLSDRFHNRSKFILLAVAGCVPGLIGITYASSYWLVLVSAGILGFFMLSTAPVGFQYCAEIGYPVPEGASTGVLMLMGQLAGIVFIFGMDIFKSPKTGSMTIPILGLIVLMLFSIPISAKLRESELMRKNNDKIADDDETLQQEV
jgi:cyanate permease